VNNMAEGYERLSRRLDRPLDQRVAQRVDRFVTGSRAAGAQLHGVLGVASEHVVAIPNTILARPPARSRRVVREELGISADAIVFAVIAGLEERKGHVHLFRAVAGLMARDQWRGATLVLAGCGPMEGKLRDMAADLGLRAVVHWLGFHERPQDVLAACDVLVLPSESDEDFPLVILEAMAAGRAVIATRVAGAPEQVVDGETGLLVPPANPVELAGALTSVMSDRQLRERLGASGRRRFDSNYGREQAIASYRSLLDEVRGRRVAEV
jgi:glycosyltransferase involved in cell wall biosynthesis